MSVSRRLTLGFLIVLFLTAVVSITGIVGVQHLRKSGSNMYERRVTSLYYIISAKTSFARMRLAGRGLVINSLYDDKETAEQNSADFDKYALEFKEWMEKYEEVSDTPELVELYDKIMTQFNDYYFPNATSNNIDCINDIPSHENKLAINQTIADISASSDAIDGYLIDMVNANNKLAELANDDNAMLAFTITILQALLLLMAAAIAISTARIIVKSITEPIREVVAVLGCIGGGDFFAQIEGDYKGEFGVIKDSVNSTAMQLAVYINEMKVAQELVFESCMETARVEAAAEAMMSGINYASSIQRNILPSHDVFREAFSDYSIIWKPRDIVSGDIYWLQNFESGSLLCVCDCTGHGTPGALLTMLVTSIFNSSINAENCADTAQIIYTLDRRIYESLNAHQTDADALKDGCDLAVLFVAKDGSVTLSAAHTRVFICDGKNVEQIKGQNIYVGEGGLKGKEDVEITKIPANASNKFYVASDGLFDQTGGEKGVPFGYRKFINLITENHNECQSLITEKVWDTFEEYRRGTDRLDDFELIGFSV